MTDKMASRTAIHDLSKNDGAPHFKVNYIIYTKLIILLYCVGTYLYKNTKCMKNSRLDDKEKPDNSAR